MDNPIIFIHKGTSWYLYNTVKQAHDRNPSSEIVVISDCAQPELTRYASVYRLQDYWSSAQAFESLYQHLSTNSYQFELFCFQRWFVVAEFVKKHAPRRLIHVDSDLLVFDDLETEYTRIADADLALVGLQGPFSLFLPDVRIVGRFCDHITDLFKNQSGKLAADFAEWRKDGAETAVSDMHALHTFIDAAKLKVVDLGRVHDGSVYDSVIHLSDGFKMEHGFKKLKWENRQPYVQFESTGEWIRLKTIHCQGPSKAKILDYFTERDLYYRRDKLVEKARKVLGRSIGRA